MFYHHNVTITIMHKGSSIPSYFALYKSANLSHWIFLLLELNNVDFLANANLSQLKNILQNILKM